MDQIKFAITAGLMALAMIIVGMSACDVRNNQYKLDMASKGFCLMPYTADKWIPCPKPQ